MKPVHGGRWLLNEPGHQTTAAIVAEIQDTTGWPAGKVQTWDGKWIEIEKASNSHSQPDYTLQISDCDRSIKFDLCFSDDEEMDNNLYKIDALLDALKEFRKGLVKEQKLYLKRKKAIAQAKDR